LALSSGGKRQLDSPRIYSLRHKIYARATHIISGIRYELRLVVGNGRLPHTLIVPRMRRRESILTCGRQVHRPCLLRWCSGYRPSHTRHATRTRDPATHADGAHHRSPASDHRPAELTLLRRGACRAMQLHREPGHVAEPQRWSVSTRDSLALRSQRRITLSANPRVLSSLAVVSVGDS
jgi:hypothetical protein